MLHSIGRTSNMFCFVALSNSVYFGRLYFTKFSKRCDTTEVNTVHAVRTLLRPGQSDPFDLVASVTRPILEWRDCMKAKVCCRNTTKLASKG
jgi:hypothetical protein